MIGTMNLSAAGLFILISLFMGMEAEKNPRPPSMRPENIFPLFGRVLLPQAIHRQLIKAQRLQLQNASDSENETETTSTRSTTIAAVSDDTGQQQQQSKSELILSLGPWPHLYQNAMRPRTKLEEELLWINFYRARSPLGVAAMIPSYQTSGGGDGGGYYFPNSQGGQEGPSAYGQELSRITAQPPPQPPYQPSSWSKYEGPSQPSSSYGNGLNAGPSGVPNASYTVGPPGSNGGQSPYGPPGQSLPPSTRPIAPPPPVVPSGYAQNTQVVNAVLVGPPSPAVQPSTDNFGFGFGRPASPYPGPNQGDASSTPNYAQGQQVPWNSNQPSSWNQIPASIPYGQVDRPAQNGYPQPSLGLQGNRPITQGNLGGQPNASSDYSDEDPSDAFADQIASVQSPYGRPGAQASTGPLGTLVYQMYMPAAAPTPPQNPRGPSPQYPLAQPSLPVAGYYGQSAQFSSSTGGIQPRSLPVFCCPKRGKQPQ